MNSSTSLSRVVYLQRRCVVCVCADLHSHQQRCDHHIRTVKVWETIHTVGLKGSVMICHRAQCVLIAIHTGVNVSDTMSRLLFYSCQRQHHHSRKVTAPIRLSSPALTVDSCTQRIWHRKKTRREGERYPGQVTGCFISYVSEHNAGTSSSTVELCSVGYRTRTLGRMTLR
jgi:hypothetical protein